MKISKIHSVVIIFGSLVLSSCSNFDREGLGDGDASDYLIVRNTPELVIPTHMDAMDIEDLWEVPQIEERPLAPFFPDEAPRPAPIIGDADPDLVRIQNLGDRSWMVVQRAPETVWPVVKQWLQDSGFVVRHEDPRKGILFTDRISLDSAQPESIQALIKQGKLDSNINGGADWLAMRLENGIRRGSTEVHLRIQNERTEDSISTIVWPEESVSVDLERTILTSLANYDASGYVAPTVSIEASNISLLPKAEVITDAEGFPLLRLYVDFTRAWATIQKALENAEFEVLSQEVPDRYFEVQVSEEVLRSKQKNFLLRLIRLGNEGSNKYPSTVRIYIENSDSVEDIFLVRLSNAEEGIALSVEFASELLLILREHAI